MLKIFGLLLVVSIGRAWAGGLVREDFEGVRPLAMGNAYLALADDANLLWYNPAGLAKVKGPHLDLFDFALGADGMTTITNFKNAIFDGNFNGLIKTDTTNIRFDVSPTFVSKYFGFQVFSRTSGFWDIQELKLPAVDVFAYSDLGAIAGIGLPITDYFSFGISGRAFIRSGVDANLTAQSLLSELGGITESDFMNAIYDKLKSLAGYGYGIGIDVGGIAYVPLGDKKAPRLQLGATIQDLGNTAFHSIGSSTPPPSIPMSYNVGGALIYPINKDSEFHVTTDFRHLMAGLPMVKTSHFGLEYKHKYFALQTGLGEGYLSYGVSWTTLPHTQVNFASYAAELGDGWLQRGQRFYVLQAVIGFNPF